jgi:hypothetical protein
MGDRYEPDANLIVFTKSVTCIRNLGTSYLGISLFATPLVMPLRTSADELEPSRQPHR